MDKVAIDIETTGLDPKIDAITEIAAVRFNDKGIVNQYQTLVNPNRPIPSNIQALTHITNEMVNHAPQAIDVMRPLAEFVGMDTVVGHNISFDLSFLRQGGILRSNPFNDTYELAAVLLPCSPRYNLSALGQQFNIAVTNAHRALADCITTYQVYNKLVEIIRSMPLNLLIELLSVAGSSGWNGINLLREILQERIKNGEKRDPDYRVPLPKVSSISFSNQDELKPKDTLEPLDSEELSSILEYGGAFSHQFPNYEQRPQQIEMLKTISDAFSNGRHMFIEAGTGTGKSFAYLIPAYYWAVKNGERVIISTNTINLQDQLINKDIPELERVLNVEIRATVQKGRSNYLCSKRFMAAVSKGAENPDEMRVLGKLLVWCTNGSSGDRSEINLNGPIDRDYWNRMSAENEGCRANQCPFRRKGVCPFYAVRDRAVRSHIIIVNHALLLTDVATQRGVLPDYKYLIIDEGHHLESAATSALGFKTTPYDMTKSLQELGNSRNGLIGRLLTSLENELSPEGYADILSKSNSISECSSAIEPDQKNFLDLVSYFMEQSRDSAPLTVYGQQVRITSAARTETGWSDIEISWDKLHNDYLDLIKGIKDLYQSLSAEENLEEDTMEMVGLLGGFLKDITALTENLDHLFMDPDPNNVYWLELSPINNRLSMNIAPLQVGPLIEQYLWHQKESVILTSATLTTADNSFEYLKERLSADEADELSVGSPFDYESSVLFYMPNDIPDPNQVMMQKVVEQALVNLCKATGGRTLALFTSYAQLKRTSNAISPVLSESGITVFEQGEGISATVLLETFRKTEKALLLGTKSFWEGVDIQGEQLSVVVIVKLPFDVPSDPIIAARSENFENSFGEYNLPEAILKFRQGFGRLIRSQSDRGVIVVLDNRLMKKSYGREFINSIPKCTMKTGSIRDLPHAATQWLNI